MSRRGFEGAAALLAAGLITSLAISAPASAQGPATMEDAPLTAPPVSDAPTEAHTVDAETLVRRLNAGNDFVLQASRIARERAEAPAVRDLAARLIADHEALAARVAARGENETEKAPVAGETGSTLPEPPAFAADLAALEATPAGAFDAAYLKGQADAATDLIRLLTGYAETGGDPALRDLALTTLPLVQEHQTAIAQLQK